MWSHPRLACGMIGSRQGWREAPYVECPAPIASLAAGIVRVPGDVLAIVPGVRTRDANDIPDVLRGEETQIAGAVDEQEDRVLAVLPGTHCKSGVGRERTTRRFCDVHDGGDVRRAAESQHSRAPRAAGRRRIRRRFHPRGNSRPGPRRYES